jgi:hypothetical protein
VIESWLAAPQPVVGRDIAPLEQINTRLTRLTGGPQRYVLILVAILCLLAGFWPEKDPSAPGASSAKAPRDGSGARGLFRRVRRFSATSGSRP